MYQSLCHRNFAPSFQKGGDTPRRGDEYPRNIAPPPSLRKFAPSYKFWIFDLKTKWLQVEKSCMCQLKKSFDNTNNCNNHHSDYFLTMSLRINTDNAKYSWCAVKRHKHRLFWGNEGLCDLFTEARSAEVNKHISPRCLKITYLFFILRGRVNESE